MKIIGADQIKEALCTFNPLPIIEQGFIAYSTGQAVAPPVGELLFTNPPGDVHIKYGYLVDDAYYVVKIASGFYENPKYNLPSSNGLLLLFSQKTGELLSILLDEGYLTDLRTAIAGAIVAKHLAPKQVHCIGILGTGTQARLQLRLLVSVSGCRDVIVWGRDKKKLASYQKEMEAEGFSVSTTQDVRILATRCNLIITTTASSAPILWADQIQHGTHITAVGADTPYKQELDPLILQRASCVVADSIAQCMERGEIAHALQENLIEQENVIELGHILSGEETGRTSEEEITIADLTGVAVQDIQITKAIYETICRE